MKTFKKILGRAIPGIFVRKYHHYKVQQKFRGGTNRIETDDVAMSVLLGRHIYLAKNVDVRNNVYIGDYSYCNKGTILFDGTQIGRYCSIGYNVQIGCPEHPTFFFSTSPNIYRSSYASRFIEWPSDDYKNPVAIGNDVWIGSNVIILQGVIIGDGAIIAAGAVVNKEVEPYTIVGGVPAKLIKRRFSLKMEHIVMASNWWDYSIEEIEKFAEKLYLGENSYENSSTNSD